jgi:long-chain acyl-CoA synthetase
MMVMHDPAGRSGQKPPAWLGAVPALRAEMHFDGRAVRCFAERPKSTYTLLAEALAANPDGEAIVCGG